MPGNPPAAPSARRIGDHVPLQPVRSKAAWTVPEVLGLEGEWRYVLTPQDREEVLTATARAVATGKGVLEITREDFPLPTFGPKLEGFVTNVLEGLGFQLLRGFPVERLGKEEVVYAYYGTSLYWGDAVPNNGAGHVVCHIKDLVHDLNDPRTRGYTTNAAQPFHVDGGHLVTLLVLRNDPAKGGSSQWASSYTVYNQLLKERPDLAAELARPLPIYRKNEQAPGQRPYLEVPVLSWHQGVLTVFYIEPYFLQSQLVPEAPRLSPGAIEGLRLLREIAARPEFHLSCDLEPGDVQILHNWTNVHGRTAFESEEDPAHRRHLLRLWVVPKNGHPLDPEVFRDVLHGLGTDNPPSAPFDAGGAYREGAEPAKRAKLNAMQDWEAAVGVQLARAV